MFLETFSLLLSAENIYAFRDFSRDSDIPIRTFQMYLKLLLARVSLCKELLETLLSKVLELCSITLIWRLQGSVNEKITMKDCRSLS